MASRGRRRPTRAPPRGLSICRKSLVQTSSAAASPQRRGSVCRSGLPPSSGRGAVAVAGEMPQRQRPKENRPFSGCNSPLGCQPPSFCLPPSPPPRSFTTRNPAATPAREGRTQDQPAGPPRPLTRAWGLVTTSTGGPTGHVGCRGHRSAGQPRVQRDRKCLAEVGGTRTLGADGSPVTGTWA